MPRELEAAVREIAEEMRARDDRGAVATYIPELADTDPGQFGIAVALRDGGVIASGDCDKPFSIQSISKVFTLTLALGKLGDRLWARVGREPSGSPFNSIVQLEAERGIPRNPFINAGALAVTDAILSGHQPKEALGAIVRFMQVVADDETVFIDQAVAASEERTGHRNAALAHYMKAFGVLENPVKGERLLRVVGLVAGNRLEVLGEEAIERRLERGKLSARMPQDLRPARVVQQRVEQVLDGQVGVPPRRRLAVGGLQHQLEFSADLTHASSIIPFRSPRAEDSPAARPACVPQ